MRTREEKLADNEILFRQLNERIAELTDTWAGQLDAVCECADASCYGVLRIGRDEYEHLRQDSRRFAVLPGHEVQEIETVIEHHDTYLVVEKRVQHTGSEPAG